MQKNSIFPDCFGEHYGKVIGCSMCIYRIDCSAKCGRATAVYREINIDLSATATLSEFGTAYGHYWKSVKDLDGIDVYRVLELFEVKSHAVGHAVKKLLCSGQRGDKDERQDIEEAIASLRRHLDMMDGK